MVNPEIILLLYDERWTELYAQESERILAAMGPNCAGIEHIGSTAVPGLWAKPVIDILIGVESLVIADKECIEPLVNLGYAYDSHHESKMPERRFFKKDTPEGIRQVHLHLVEIDSKSWKRHVAFRDYLREHKEALDEYNKLKKSLLDTTTTREEYTQAKTPFIIKIEQKAGVFR